MSNLTAKCEHTLRERILRSLHSAIQNGALPSAEIPDFRIEIPADRSHGDYAVNAALVCAKAFRMPPGKIAETISAYLDLSGTFFDSFQIAFPGFINFNLKPEFYSAVLQEIKSSGQAYGCSDYGRGQKVCLEFVSANPTGPMHLGNARGGALGDCLAALMDAAGFQVTKEFYINDAGNQIEKLGLSLEIRYLQLLNGEDSAVLPDDAYHGQDIRDRAAEFAATYGDRYLSVSSEERRKALTEFTLPRNIEQMRAQLLQYMVDYDVWFPESGLHGSGEVLAVVDIMTQKGLTYEKDGAVWYRATEYGGEKDEVLIRSNGIPSYFAADIAYHRNKFETRGFDLAIDIWGTDHHGHVARLKGALDAIGLQGSRLHIILMQLVRLMKNGEVIRMSKRTGKAISLVDLLEEIPVDAARFFFNMREPNSQMEFDMDLAVEQSSKNPVYYVQYAHARICSILAKLREEGVESRDCTTEELCRLDAPEERELIRHLSRLTDEIVSAIQNYNPAQITRYSLDLAGLFHKFYTACRVKNEDEPLMQARLQLCLAVRDTLRNILGMLKISAPDAM